MKTRRGKYTHCVTLSDPEDRAAHVYVNYTRGTSDHFDKSFGNWLPGDPDDVEVVSVEPIDEGCTLNQDNVDLDAVLELIDDEPDDDYDEDPDPVDRYDKEYDY